MLVDIPNGKYKNLESIIDKIVSLQIVCPHCYTALKEDDNNLACSKCNRTYPVRNGIPDFRQKDDYWCNVSREKMQNLNRKAEETGDWLNSAREIIPEYADHFIPYYRADSQFLWPTDKESCILDAGSMWGGLTIPTAQLHREVYAVDKTLETLEFLKIRAKQMRINNIHPIAASLKSLPFPDNFFDHVILNGVLEWVGLEEDVILEKHWSGKREERQLYSKTPEEMQLDVLKNLHRVLRPGGSIYIAIENRYGIQYFLTCPDDHNNVRFVSFLPRFLADKISRLFGKGKYRTYTYSPKQLAVILKKSGFKKVSMYGVFPHYIKIKKAFPLKITHLFKNEVKLNGALPRILHKVIKPLMPSNIACNTIPSLFAICAKNEQNELIPRIQSLLIKANVLNKNDNFSFVISNNRYENCNSTNIIIYDRQNNPLYFCKIARDLTVSGLRAEAENLEWITNNMSAAKEFDIQTPKLICYKVTKGVEIFVSTFLSAKNIKLTSHYIFNKGLNKLGINNSLFRKSIAFIEEKIFLRRIDKKVELAIDALANFQQSTLNNRTTMKEISENIINKYLDSKPNILNETKKALLSLKDRICLMPEIVFSTCSVHGDYDFDNIFFQNGKIGLVDFEHMEKDGSPFFDLATLIFNPLIMKWKSSFTKDKSFVTYLNKYGGVKYVIKWLRHFCDKRNMPHSLIPIIPLISAVDQNSKIYPPYRDPNTYPLYGENMLTELLSLKISDK